MAIRAGARPVAAARWLGVRKNTWKNWRLRQGEPYDTLRERMRGAVAHLEVKLLADLAKKSPGAALKQLRRPDDSPDRARYIARMAKEKPWEMLGLTIQEELFLVSSFVKGDRPRTSECSISVSAGPCNHRKDADAQAAWNGGPIPNFPRSYPSGSQPISQPLNPHLCHSDSKPPGGPK